MCAAQASSSTKLEGPEKGKIFQFKVKLLESDPKIWRRIQLQSDATFWDLHCAIQNSMGWNDNHIHFFEVKNPKNGKTVKIGKPIEKGGAWSEDEMSIHGFINSPIAILAVCMEFMRTDVRNMHASWKAPLAKYYNANDFQYDTKYTYDFGNFWVHEVIFEGVSNPKRGTNYPKCIEGERACPPEDCGGIDAYKELLVNLKKKDGQRTKDEKEKMEWLNSYSRGQEFDPDFFDPDFVHFVNSDGWLKYKKNNTLATERLRAAQLEDHMMES